MKNFANRLVIFPKNKLSNNLKDQSSLDVNLRFITKNLVVR
jgi:hypothetical protein